ncbi:MAG: glucose-phosphate cytidylyltransferase [Actinomycetota bacterium]|jgi:glucose-1-phosphate cytidylyltransferase
MQTVILCGGKGTRAYPHTETLPKPLLEVDGIPVMRHVMDLYAAQGHVEFVLAAGYKHELVAEYAASSVPKDWSVTVLDTGEESDKGERVLQCRDHVDGTFFVTYADGLGNVDLEALAKFHSAHGGLATMTTVPLPSQYGTVEFDDDGRVERFREKPQLPDHWINAGFFVFESAVFDNWPGGDLEGNVLPALAAHGALFARPHAGFWQSMDTYKDSLDLTALCEEGTRPWMP